MIIRPVGAAEAEHEPGGGSGAGPGGQAPETVPLCAGVVAAGGPAEPQVERGGGGRQQGRSRQANFLQVAPRPWRGNTRPQYVKLSAGSVPGRQSSPSSLIHPLPRPRLHPRSRPRQLMGQFTQLLQVETLLEPHVAPLAAPPRPGLGIPTATLGREPPAAV